MSKPTIREWRRCNGCGRVWLGSKSAGSCSRKIDGVKIHCGSGRLIRYPDRDTEVQSIINARVVV